MKFILYIMKFNYIFETSNICYSIFNYIIELFTLSKMGFFKILAFIGVPITGMTYAAFSLGKQLPKASRRMGNYIGLSYVYFKCTLKVLKPEDQIPYQMMEIARKAQQQSQALRRQLRNTMKKVKQDFNKKHEEVISNFSDKINKETEMKNIQKVIAKQQVIGELKTGSELMRQLNQMRDELKEKKKQKRDSRKFFDQI